MCVSFYVFSYFSDFFFSSSSLFLFRDMIKVFRSFVLFYFFACLTTIYMQVCCTLNGKSDQPTNQIYCMPTKV